jgi:hypothetical protein
MRNYTLFSLQEPPTIWNVMRTCDGQVFRRLLEILPQPMEVCSISHRYIICGFFPVYVWLQHD